MIAFNNMHPVRRRASYMRAFVVEHQYGFPQSLQRWLYAQAPCPAAGPALFTGDINVHPPAGSDASISSMLERGFASIQLNDMQIISRVRLLTPASRFTGDGGGVAALCPYLE